MSPLPSRRGFLCASLPMLAGLAACATTPAPPPLPAPMSGHDGRRVHLVRQSWHTGLVIERAALLAAGTLPETADFPGLPCLELGWGDRAYYMSSDPTVWLTLHAALAPTSAVLHIEPRACPAGSAARERLAMDFSPGGFTALALAISETVDRRSAPVAKPIARGRAPGARFYEARGSFHLFNTCNTWVARVLAAGGLPIDPDGVVTAGDLRRRARAATPARAM